MQTTTITPATALLASANPDDALPRLYQQRAVLSRLLRRRTAALGALIMIMLVIVAVFANEIAPSPYDAQNLSERLLPPAWVPGGAWLHVLGTDQLGRDMLSRLAYGARVSLFVAFLSVAIGSIVGILLGLLSGYWGGVVDNVISRAADAQLAFPYLLLSVAVIAVLGTGLFNLIVVLSLGTWVMFARTVRASVLGLKHQEFVQAAVCVGVPTYRILLKHILPNVMAPITVITSFLFAQMMLMEASLSFLGLGVQPPLPSWGGMLGDGRSYFTSAWWLAVLPGLSIMLAVLGANLLGDGLRDALDPRLKID